MFAAFNFGDTELKDYELTLPGKGKITAAEQQLELLWRQEPARPKALSSKTTTGNVKLTLAPTAPTVTALKPAVEKETK